MTFIVRPLGSALLVTLALLAAWVPAASAESFSFHSVSPATNLVGAQVNTQKFSYEAGSTTCKKASLSGTMSAEESGELSLVPEYSECTADPSGNSTVTSSGCKYLLKPGEKIESTYKANLSLSCESGKTLTIKVTVLGVTKCTITIPGQELGSVTVSEVGSGEEIRSIAVAASLEKLKYTQKAGEGFGACATHENTTNGSYSGELKITGNFSEYGEKEEVSVGMEALAAVINIEPAEYQFKQGKSKLFEIENLTNNQIKINSVRADPNFFKLMNDNCTGQMVDGHKKCTFELKCEKALPVAGQKSPMFAVSDKPRDVDAALLECTA